MQRRAWVPFLLFGWSLSIAWACAPEANTRLLGVSPYAEAVIVNPTIVGRVYTGYGPQGRVRRAQMWIGRSSRAKLVAPGDECAIVERRFRTDTLGEFLLPARARPRSQIENPDSALQQSICIGERTLDWGLRIFDLPERRWTGGDTLYLHCMVHTGIIDCLPVSKRDFPGHRPDAG